MDTISLIIVISVIIPALVAFAICILIFYSRRNQHQKFQQPRSSTDEYHHSPERTLEENYIIDFSSAYRYQQQRRLREHPRVSEQSPPSYNSPIYQTRRQSLPLFSPIRTTPSTTYVHRASPALAPSTYSTMPPTYAEIFLTPHTLTNQ